MEASGGCSGRRRFVAPAPGGKYCLTLSIHGRTKDLTHPAVASVLRDELFTVAASGDLELLAAVITPDHLHLVVELDGRLTAAALMERFERLTKVALRRRGLAWRPDFFAHRLEPADPIDELVHYLHLDSYQASQVAAGDNGVGTSLRTKPRVVSYRMAASDFLLGCASDASPGCFHRGLRGWRG